MNNKSNHTHQANIRLNTRGLGGAEGGHLLREDTLAGEQSVTDVDPEVTLPILGAVLLDTRPGEIEVDLSLLTIIGGDRTLLTMAAVHHILPPMAGEGHILTMLLPL